MTQRAGRCLSGELTMTVSTEVNHNEYTGNGVTTSFPYTFRVFHASDLVVTTSDTSGTLRTLILNTDYTVTGVGSYSGGSVVLPLPLANAWAISIERSLPVVQETDLRNQGKFFAETHEGAFDYLTMLIQQCFGWLRLALLKPNFLAKYYDAKQNRISNLADPVVPQDAVNNRSMRNYVDAAIAGVVGGYGWFIQYGAGAVYRTFQDKMRESVSVKDFGAKGDGVTDDTSSFINALNSGACKVRVPKGVYVITSKLEIPVGVILIGEGTDYWDTYRPSPGRLIKRMDKGTTLLMKGTGADSERIYNLPNTRTTKTNSSGVSFPFTDFTLNDSVNGSPATPKAFSCAMKITRNSGLKDLRIMINYDGINGYNDASLTGLGDDWDVGLWVYDANGSIVENVQVVGYWRMAALLHTENDGTYDMVGNPEQTVFRNVYLQGRRGYLVRNSPQHRVISNTANTITTEYTSSWTLSHAMKVRIFRNSTTYSFTGYSASGGQITLTGVTPALPANVTAIRAPNMGNNFSGSVFESCKFNSLEHTSGTPSYQLGLGEAGALEADGFPCRNIRLVGTKCQTVFDRLNSLFGDSRDWKFVSAAFENGAMVAYGYAETNQVGFTGNMRMGIETEIGDSRLDWSLFTPRDGFLADKQLPTQNTDGKTVFKNWQAKGLEIQYAGGQVGVLLRDSDNYLRLFNGLGQQAFQCASNNATTVQGNNVYIAGATGETIMSAFTSTKNVTFAAAVTVTGDAIAMANVRPNVANANTVGTSIFPFAGGFTQTAFQVTSDRRAKMEETDLDEAEKRVAVRLKALLKKYKLCTSVEEKGVGNARWHCGIVAQDVIQAFEAEGLNATSYAMLCHTFHAASEAIVEEDGTVISPAIEEGDSYTVRYEELYAFILSAI